jgi:hypothetical protein
MGISGLQCMLDEREDKSRKLEMDSDFEKAPYEKIN